MMTATIKMPHDAKQMTRIARVIDWSAVEVDHEFLSAAFSVDAAACPTFVSAASASIASGRSGNVTLTFAGVTSNSSAVWFVVSNNTVIQNSSTFRLTNLSASGVATLSVVSASTSFNGLGVAANVTTSGCPTLTSATAFIYVASGSPSSTVALAVSNSASDRNGGPISTLSITGSALTSTNFAPGVIWWYAPPAQRFVPVCTCSIFPCTNASCSDANLTFSAASMPLTTLTVSNIGFYQGYSFLATLVNAFGSTNFTLNTPCLYNAPVVLSSVNGGGPLGTAQTLSTTLAPGTYYQGVTNVSWLFSNNNSLVTIDNTTASATFSAPGVTTLTLQNVTAPLSMSFYARFATRCAAATNGPRVSFFVCNATNGGTLPTFSVPPRVSFSNGISSTIVIANSPGTNTLQVASGAVWLIFRGGSFTPVCVCRNFTVQTCLSNCSDPNMAASFAFPAITLTVFNNLSAYNGTQFTLTLTNACGGTTTSSPFVLCTDPLPIVNTITATPALPVLFGSASITANISSFRPSPNLTWIFASNLSAVPISGSMYSVGPLVNGSQTLFIQNISTFALNRLGFALIVNSTCNSVISNTVSFTVQACQVLSGTTSGTNNVVSQVWDRTGTSVTFTYSNSSASCSATCSSARVARPGFTWQYCVGTAGSPGLPCTRCPTCSWFDLATSSIAGLTFSSSACGPGSTCSFSIANATGLYWYSFRMLVDCSASAPDQDANIPSYTVFPPNPLVDLTQTVCPPTAGIPQSRIFYLAGDLRDFCSAPQALCNDPLTGYTISNHPDFDRAIACDGNGGFGGVPNWITGNWTPVGGCMSILNRYLDPVLGVPTINCSAATQLFPGSNCSRTNTIWNNISLLACSRVVRARLFCDLYDVNLGWLNSYFWTCQVFFPLDNYLMGNYSYSTNTTLNRNFGMTMRVSNNFTYVGGEVFNFIGDDDVWVFLNKQLVMDMGGVHGAQRTILQLDRVAPLVGMQIGGTYQFDLFYNERHITRSTLAFATSIQFSVSQCNPASQPLFASGCTANITLILDTGSKVSCCQSNCAPTATTCQSIRNAIANFASSMYQQSLSTGSPVFLSVIRYGSVASLDFSMTQVTPTFIRTLTAWLNSQYLTGTTTPLGPNSNWADAINLANSLPAPMPNLVIMFVADRATVSGPLHVPPCTVPISCTRQAPIDACYEANQFKLQTNAKIFVIGIGNVGQQSVSGTVIWDGAPQNFASSDYIVASGIGAIPGIFLQIGKSLCPCLRDQICRGTDCQTEFSAKFTVQESATSNWFSPNGVSSGYIYYAFDSDDQNIAFQVFTVPYPSGQSFQTTTAISIQREDIINPCTTTRLVSCSSTCTALRTSVTLPRFFHDVGDVNLTDNVQNPTISNGTRLPLCTEGYQRSSASASSSAQIQYIWGKRDSLGRYVVCAAQAFDGTIWRFYLNDGATLGAYLGTPIQMPPGLLYNASCGNGFCELGETSVMNPCIAQSTAPCCSDCPSFYPPVGSTGFACVGQASGRAPTCQLIGALSANQTNWCAISGICGSTAPLYQPYNFGKLDSLACSSTTTCNQAVELVFLIDQQSTISASNYFNLWLPFVSRFAARFNSTFNPAIRFQLAFPNSNGNPWTSSPLLPIAASPGSPPYSLTSSQATLNNFLSASLLAGGATDFVATAIAAINQYWPAAPTSRTSPPRNLFIMVGGPDSPNPSSGQTYADLAFLARIRGVTVWAYGIGTVGSAQLVLINNLATSTANQLFAFSDAALASSDADLWLQLCPANEQLCRDCAGFCACGGVCVCPSTCSNNPCAPSSCDPLNPQAGCVSTSFPCPVGDTCFSSSVCIVNSTGSPVCQPRVPVNCTDSHFCTYDYCLLGVGCQNVPYSATTAISVAQVCPAGSTCLSTSCNATTDTCQYTPIPYSPQNKFCNQPCKTASCSPTSLCDNAICIQDLVTNTTSPLGCDGLNGQAAVDCVRALSDPTPLNRWYCYRTPTVCPSDKCGYFSCDLSSGSCSNYTQNVSCSDGDFCTLDSCNRTTGCVFTPVSGASLLSVCPSGSSCQTTTCTNSTCRYTPITTGVCGCSASGCTTTETDACQKGTCVYTASDCSNSTSCLSSVSQRGYFCNLSPIPCPHLQCQTATCSASSNPPCQYASVTCDDKNLCTDDICSNDSCLNPSNASKCNARFDPCFTWTCDPARGCVSTPKPGGCTDPCARAPCSPVACSTTTCVSNVTFCPSSSSSSCQAAIADPSFGYFCDYQPLACGSDACGPLVCDGNAPGSCVRGDVTKCDDGDSCTTDFCVGTPGFAACQNVLRSDVLAFCPDAVSCQTTACNNSQCLYPAVTTGSCGCSSCPLPGPCQVSTCIYAGSSTISCGASGNASACNAALSDPSKQFYCDVQPVVCAAPVCQVGVCDPSSNTCKYSSLTCDDGDACTFDFCDMSSGSCKYAPLTGSALAQYCPVPNQDPCFVPSCKSSICNFTRITQGLCALSPCEATACPTPADKCRLPACADTTASCSSSFATNSTALTECLAALDSGSASRYCGSVPKQCAPSNVCVQNVCDGLAGNNTGQCITTVTSCAPPNNCVTAACNVSAGGCVYSPYPCSFAPCAVGVCVDNGFPNCTVTGKRICDDGLICTTDTCNPTTGCIYTPRVCEPTGGADGCNVTLGCFEPGNEYGLPAGCQESVVSALIDFCGVCKGDNEGCFFSSLLQAGPIAGISAGVAAAITIACVVALLLAAWLSKRGYDYYRNIADMQSASMHQNPYYAQNELAGSIPTTRDF